MTVTARPPPGRGSTVSRASCAVATASTMDSPRPSPSPVRSAERTPAGQRSGGERLPIHPAPQARLRGNERSLLWRQVRISRCLIRDPGHPDPRRPVQPADRHHSLPFFDRTRPRKRSGLARLRRLAGEGRQTGSGCRHRLLRPTPTGRGLGRERRLDASRTRLSGRVANGVRWRVRAWRRRSRPRGGDRRGE